MAFVKVLSVALCLSAASGAPQYATTLAQPQVVRTVSHAAPTVVRTVAQPQFHTIAAQPQFHTIAAQPQFHTIAAQPQFHTIAAQPQVFRTNAVHAVHAAPAATHTVVRASPAVSYEEVEEVEGDASYSFGYSIADAASGDSKTREETADHGIVRGSYSVADPDGRVRVVTYTADAENGFQAQVTYDGEEGPVAIPFDAPAQTTTVVSSAAPAATIIAARGSQAVHAVHNVAAAPQAVHAIHNVRSNAQHFVQAQPTTVLRSNAQHFVHAQPAATTVVRSGAQFVQAQPQFIQAQPQFIQAQPQFIQAQPQFVRSFNDFGTRQLVNDH